MIWGQSIFEGLSKFPGKFLLCVGGRHCAQKMLSAGYNHWPSFMLAGPSTASICTRIPGDFTGTTKVTIQADKKLWETV